MHFVLPVEMGALPILVAGQDTHGGKFKAPIRSPRPGPTTLGERAGESTGQRKGIQPIVARVKFVRRPKLIIN